MTGKRLGLRRLAHVRRGKVLGDAKAGICWPTPDVGAILRTSLRQVRMSVDSDSDGKVGEREEKERRKKKREKSPRRPRVPTVVGSLLYLAGVCVRISASSFPIRHFFNIGFFSTSTPTQRRAGIIQILLTIFSMAVDQLIVDWFSLSWLQIIRL